MSQGNEPLVVSRNVGAADPGFKTERVRRDEVAPCASPSLDPEGSLG